MKKIKNKVSVYPLVVTVFCGLFLLVTSLMNFWHTVETGVASRQVEGDSRAKTTAFENSLRDDYKGKEFLMNAYGFGERLLGKKIIGNFEYIKDSEGVLHFVNENGYRVEEFKTTLGKIKEKLDEKNIPFVYVQGLNREYLTPEEPISAYNPDEDAVNNLMNWMDTEGNISHIDLRETAKKELSERPFLRQPFFRTDTHMTTEAELWAAEKMTELLANYQIPLSNLQYITNPEEYFTVYEQPFNGNYVRNIGKYYTKEDIFKIYLPNFDTNYSIITWGFVDEAEGDFKKTLIHDIDMNDPELDEYTYYVTKYMYYGYPYVTIVNNQVPEGKLLILTDSMGYRSIAHLSLTVHEITVLDPRFFGDTPYLINALNDREYDLAMLYQNAYIIDYNYGLE